jgi:hypothetical protein
MLQKTRVMLLALAAAAIILATAGDAHARFGRRGSWGSNGGSWGSNGGSWGSNGGSWGSNGGSWGSNGGSWGSNGGSWGSNGGRWGSNGGRWGGRRWRSSYGSCGSSGGYYNGNYHAASYRGERTYVSNPPRQYRSTAQVAARNVARFTTVVSKAAETLGQSSSRHDSNERNASRDRGQKRESVSITENKVQSAAVRSNSSSVSTITNKNLTKHPADDV